MYITGLHEVPRVVKVLKTREQLSGAKVGKGESMLGVKGALLAPYLFLVSTTGNVFPSLLRTHCSSLHNKEKQFPM